MSYPYPWQQMPYQRIQNISTVSTTEAQVFFANNPQDMDKISPQPNVLYIGLNLPSKEIYLKQMNGMGLIDFYKYTHQSGEQQKNDLTKILDKLDEIMKGKENVIQSSNDTISNEYVDKGNVEKSPDNATIQPNDVR